MIKSRVPPSILSAFRFVPCLLAALVSCAICYAEPVTLVVWVEDAQGTFSRSEFRKYMIARQEGLSTPLKGVFVSRSTSWSTAIQEIKSTIGTDDQVAGLILATHGNSSRLANRASLQGLGSFGRGGTRGPLKDLIRGLEGRWSDSVAIFLASCSTFCGSTARLGARTQSLYSDFRKVGVRKIWVWGAHQPLINDGTRGFAPTFTENFIPALLNGLAGAALAGMGAYTYSGSDVLALVAGLATFYPSVHMTAKLLDDGPLGSAGSLVAVDERSVEVINVDATDPRLKDLVRCERLFASGGSNGHLRN